MGVFVHLNAEIRVEPLDPREPVAIYPEHLQVLEPLPVVLAVCVSMHPWAHVAKVNTSNGEAVVLIAVRKEQCLVRRVSNSR